jgi:N-acetylmuramoyl-L-alanine amidase
MLSIDTLLPEPESDFAAKRIGSARHPTPHYAKFLRGVKVCLDPGHGGDAHQRAFKRGPTGVREAEMNLRVAQYLRELLTASGAEVKLTRAGDYDLSLRERAGVANAWGADLFISIHHNAVGNPKTNYTSIWYHGDVDFHPANLDLARYLGEGLYDHLPLEQLTDVPLKSDQLMYPGGFGVLAAARVTSALTEISFFTNPAEEQRLRDPEYNFREAYALFIGLARYAQAGLPRARLLAPADGVVRFLAPDAPADADDQPALGDDALAEPGADDGALAATDEAPPATDAHAAPAPAALLVVQLDDGLRGRRAWGSERQMILTGSLAVRINDEPMEFVFTPGDYRLFISVPADLPPGEHALEVQFTNKNKNSVLNPHFTFTVAP